MRNIIEISEKQIAQNWLGTYYAVRGKHFTRATLRKHAIRTLLRDMPTLTEKKAAEFVEEWLEKREKEPKSAREQQFDVLCSYAYAPRITPEQAMRKQARATLLAMH